MLRKNVKRLRKGDTVLVETHFGDLVERKVALTDKYCVYVYPQVFSVKSGWEVIRESATTAGKVLRDRIHIGDGKLFTLEDQENRNRLMAPHYKRLDLLMKIQTAPSGSWLSISMDDLQEIYDKLYRQKI